jgi:hypothetical protein
VDAAAQPSVPDSAPSPTHTSGPPSPTLKDPIDHQAPSPSPTSLRRKLSSSFVVCGGP